MYFLDCFADLSFHSICLIIQSLLIFFLGIDFNTVPFISNFSNSSFVVIE